MVDRQSFLYKARSESEALSNRYEILCYNRTLLELSITTTEQDLITAINHFNNLRSSSEGRRSKRQTEQGAPF